MSAPSGPAAFSACPEPRKRPVPIVPAIYENTVARELIYMKRQAARSEAGLTAILSQKHK